MHNYNNGTLSYDIYLSAANSQAMSWSATYWPPAYQYAPTGSLYQVAFANLSASMKSYLVGDVCLTPIVKVAGNPVTTPNIGVDFTTATDVTAADWVGVYNKADGIPASRSNALTVAYTLTSLKVDVSKRLNFGIYIIKVGNETFKVVVR